MSKKPAEIPSAVFLAFDTEFEAEVFDKFLKTRKGKFYESCD